MPVNTRGQLSIETLIVAAALLAFLTFLLPSVSKVFDSLREHSIGLSEQKVFDEVSFKAREAATLGPGTRFAFDSTLDADSSVFSFDEKSNKLKLDYWRAGTLHSIEGNFSFSLSVPASNFSSGSYAFAVLNSGSGVLVSAQKHA